MPASKKPEDKKGRDAVVIHQPVSGIVFGIANTDCPRCHQAFVCNAANIEQCQCWGVNLAAADLGYLAKLGFSAKESGCLCRKCLLEIQNTVKNS